MIKILDEGENLQNCVKELKLLIEESQERVGLTEKLQTIKDKLEELYRLHVSFDQLVVFFSQDDQS